MIEKLALSRSAERLGLVARMVAAIPGAVPGLCSFTIYREVSGQQPTFWVFIDMGVTDGESPPRFISHSFRIDEESDDWRNQPIDDVLLNRFDAAMGQVAAFVSDGGLRR